MGGATNCPETPRQKMIGMMYLVLTAMLALNVSADILNEEEICLLNQMRPGLAQLEIGVQSTNPKTIQATMGALARVKLHYCDLPSFIASLKGIPVYGTFLDGDNMYEKELTPHGLIVMGNEGNGVSAEVAKLVNERLYIPNYPPQRETSESLNVAMATGIICAEFRRRMASV